MARNCNNQSPSQSLDGARKYYLVNRATIKFPDNEPTFGYVVKWLSKLGKATELDSLLAYADENLHPTWGSGGLYYPRDDEATNSKGRWTHLDPFTGKAAIGYSRLSVRDGQKKIYEGPWTREMMSSSTWVNYNCGKALIVLEAFGMTVKTLLLQRFVNGLAGVRGHF